MIDTATTHFQTRRSQLLSLAYQMLGELAAAEDIVQEAWLRWNKTDHDDIRSPDAWLTSVVTRLSIDQLRSARNRRESYTGTWLPEPIVEKTDGPAGLLELAQNCELALLWALERLSEEERAAFLLRKVFDTDYVDIAAVLERSEDACRQLVSRAGRAVQDQTPKYLSSPAQLEEMMLKFVIAAAAGDKQAVLELLAPDVVAVSDGGGVVRAALIPLEGADKVAQVMTHIASKGHRERGKGALPELARVNGRPAFVQMGGTEQDMIFTLRLNEAGQICWIYTLRNPVKLALVSAR
ncbi:MAG: RNA polymerase sigma-70 factor (ECF subfamily) [Halioglobus sp.]|jgi:RNA polymerase sigma-70 factor (ECF subfamily)